MIKDVVSWYKEAVFYEIYVPAFCDSNGDGTGDLPGVISRLDYLKELGVNALWLTPFYPSPLVDNGYDISNYLKVDERYGTLTDFDRLLEKAHEAGIRVIVDMVLNHTSSRHEWFEKSRRGEAGYADYYIWKENVPNNWESFFDGSAWEYDSVRKMYYYHAFSKEQACLNWSNEAVRLECMDILRFWLERGVDGFRLDVINFLKTDLTAFFADNPEKNGEQEHLYDKNQFGCKKAIASIAMLVHSYPDRFLLGEIGEEDLKLISSYTGPGLLDSAFYFNLGSMDEWNEEYLFRQIRLMEDLHAYPTLFFSSHDMRRHFSRLCEERTEKACLIAMFLLTAKGIPFLYQGEELPASDVCLKQLSDIQDVQGRYAYEKMLGEGKDEKQAFVYAKKRTRDYSRGLLDWNVFSEKQVFEGPVFLLYKELLALRREHKALRQGAYGKLTLNGKILSYERITDAEVLLVMLDFSEKGLYMAADDSILLSLYKEDGTVIGYIQKK